MDNISKVADISGGMQDESSRKMVEEKKKERAKQEAVKNFGDIYDIRSQSAELNRNSADFKNMLLHEANKNLNKIITNSGEINPEKIVISMPAEEIIKLSKMINNS